MGKQNGRTFSRSAAVYQMLSQAEDVQMSNADLLGYDLS